MGVDTGSSRGTLGAGWQPGSGVVVAMLASMTVGAQFVAARSARDALFLTQFDASALPLMVIASAAVSLGLVAVGWKALKRIPPSTHVPATFAGSAILVLMEWGLAARMPGAAARIVYLHMSGIGPILGSGFWLILSERFDPRTARKHFSEVAAAGTLGGLGGIVAAPVASAAGVAAMLPLVAVAQALCAWQLRSLSRSITTSPAREHEPEPDRAVSTVGVLRATPHLRSLALLTLLGTIAAVFIDYVFKAQVRQSLGAGGALGTFFAVYYASVNVLMFLVQAFGSRPVVDRLGLTAAVGAPSLVLAPASAIAIAVPGLRSVVAAHAGELVTRGSLHRTGHELLYMPIAAADKRAVKVTIDVGMQRSGEIAGAAMVQIVLGTAGAAPAVPLLSCAIVFSILASIVSRPLSRGYVNALEQSLLNRAPDIDVADAEDQATRTALLRTLGRRTGAAGIDAGAPHIREIVLLHSSDPEIVRRLLGETGALSAALVPHVIPLLAWDPVAQDAIRALRSVAEERVGELVDVLLDPNQPFPVRRRLARVFSVCVSQRAADGLLLALDDLRFEVRVQAARSLAAIVEKNARTRIDEDRVLDVIRREVAVSRPVWEGRRLLDGTAQPGDEDSRLEQLVGERASRSLAHVFTLLSLVLPAEPLRIAFCAMHAADGALRGTALEYLEAVLPHDIRDRLWPFLEVQPSAERRPRPREEILDDLLRSNASAVLTVKTAADRASVPVPPVSSRRSST